jgi:hypothetical protein
LVGFLLNGQFDKLRTIHLSLKTDHKTGDIYVGINVTEIIETQIIPIKHQITTSYKNGNKKPDTCPHQPADKKFKHKKRMRLRNS